MQNPTPRTNGLSRPITLSLLTAIAGLMSIASAAAAPSCIGYPRPVGWQQFAGSPTGSAFLRNSAGELIPLRRDGCIGIEGLSRLRLLLSHVVRDEPGTGFVNVVVIQASTTSETRSTIQLYRNRGWSNSPTEFSKTFDHEIARFNEALISKSQQQFDDIYRSGSITWRGEIQERGQNTYDYHKRFVPTESIQRMLSDRGTGYIASSHLIRFSERIASDDWRQSRAPGIDIDFRNARCAFIMIVRSDTVDSGYAGRYLVGRAGTDSCAEFSSFPVYRTGGFGLGRLIDLVVRGGEKLLKSGNPSQTQMPLP